MPIVVLVRADRASNGVVCAAAPSYDCSPANVHVRQRVDQLRELDGRLAGRDAGAAEEQVDGELDRLALALAGGVVEVAHVLPIVDDEDRVGRLVGERHRARDLVACRSPRS